MFISIGIIVLKSVLSAKRMEVKDDTGTNTLPIFLAVSILGFKSL